MRNQVFVLLGYYLLVCPDRSVCILIKSRPVTSLGHQCSKAKILLTTSKEF